VTSYELIKDFAGRPVCSDCWDTGVVVEQGGFTRCERCVGRHVDFSAPAMRLAETIWRRCEKNQPVDPRAFYVARALTHATSERPAPRHLLMTVAQATERGVKDAARTLRRDWLLPIGSSRGTQEGQPSGYFWILTPAEFLSWSRTFRAQAIDELVTLHRLQKQNFAELSGQNDFDFTHDLQRQIEEALV
jgi:hypothetical protein